MDTVIQLGLGIGLAGVAGIRTYFPLIIMGLITRFSETLTYRSPFKLFASFPVLVLLLGLAIYELMSVRVYNTSEPSVLLNIGFRIIGGAVIFAGVFGGFGILGGLLFGGLLAALSYLIMVRLREGYKNIAKGRNREEVVAGIEESLAVGGTLLALLFPWISFVIWGAVIVVFLRKLREQNRYGIETGSGHGGKNWR